MLMRRMSEEIRLRGQTHDHSKLGPEELPRYVETIDEFDKHPFGSDGYHAAKASLGPALAHHYQHNRHHPEHFPNSIDDMNLVDVLEMLCDWKSATQNHYPIRPGNMERSIQIAVEKYKISPQLAKILYNTARDFEML